MAGLEVPFRFQPKAKWLWVPGEPWRMVSEERGTEGTPGTQQTGRRGLQGLETMKSVQTERGRVGWRINWESGTDIYTLLYTKQKTSKDLLCSWGNSAQYSVMIYMGKESKKKNVCVCIYMYMDSLCYTPETNIALKINYIPIKVN